MPWNKGFTLIELMIVVAIIGILAAIAYPSYTQYKVRVNRIDAQTVMMDTAAKLQRYKIANFTFLKAGATAGSTVPITLSDLSIPDVISTSGQTLYDLGLSNITAGTWTLTATPKANTTQSTDGSIVINHKGERCWTKGSSCTPSATSNWDGR